MSFDDYITGGQGGIPWNQAAAFFVELRDTGPKEPVMTKEAALGLFKLAQIAKWAQDPESLEEQVQQAAMTDPNVVAAMDYQEMAAERAALQQTVQTLQEQLMQTAQAQQQADQMAQQQAANNQVLQQQLEQANASRQMAIEQAIQAKDQALGEVVNQQQHREQVMAAADQLTGQLKQVASTSPNEALAQQQAAQQQAAEAQQLAAQPAKVRKEVQEAQTAAEKAQQQAAQAQQQQQVAAAKQQMGKSASLAQIVERHREKTAAPLGIKGRLAYSGLGALAGAGHAGAEQLKHRQIEKRRGGPQFTDDEIDSHAKLMAARLRAKRDPTYFNKIRAGTARYLAEVEKADREHPGGAILRGGLKGAIVGSLAGQHIHNFGKRVKDYVSPSAASNAIKGAVG